MRLQKQTMAAICAMHGLIFVHLFFAGGLMARSSTFFTNACALVMHSWRSLQHPRQAC